MKKQAKNKFAEHDIQKTSIDGLYIIERPIFRDERGYFKEIVRLDALEKAIGKKFDFKQANHTYSLPKVIRGLHAEGWNKIVAPINGKVFVAIVDIRPESKKFGKIETLEINESNPKALYITKGLANSFCVLGNKPVDYIYMVDAYYDGSDTTAIAWDDPDLNIEWPIKDPIISDRDKGNPTMREKFPEKYNK